MDSLLFLIKKHNNNKTVRYNDITVPNCRIKSLFLFYFHTKSILVAS